MMKRLFILFLILCSLQAFSQPVTGSFGASGTTTLFKGSAKVSEFLFLPGIVSGTPSWAGAARYNPADSSMYLWTGYNWVKSGGTTGDFINNSTTQQTANFNITGNGVIGGNLDVTGSGNFAQNRVQLSHATLGGATKWYNTSGDLYSEVNPDQGGYMSSRRYVFNSAVGDPTAGTDYKGYLYMKAGVPYWSYNGTHTAIPLSSGTSLTDGDKGDITVSSSGTVWTVDKPTLSTLTYGATTTWDYSTQGTAAKVTLTGNTTLSITNLPASVTYLTLEVVQDATGSRTITLPAGTKVIGGGAGAVTLTTTGGATDIITFYYNGTTLYCNIGTNYN